LGEPDYLKVRESGS